LTPEHRRTAA